MMIQLETWSSFGHSREIRIFSKRGRRKRNLKNKNKNKSVKGKLNFLKTWSDFHVYQMLLWYHTLLCAEKVFSVRLRRFTINFTICYPLDDQMCKPACSLVLRHIIVFMFLGEPARESWWRPEHVCTRLWLSKGLLTDNYFL